MYLPACVCIMKGAASIPRKGSRGCADFINQDGLSSFFGKELHTSKPISGKEQHMSNSRIEFVSINALMLQVNMINYNRIIIN